jgi:iron complex outermembrane recepter protein
MRSLITLSLIFIFNILILSGSDEVIISGNTIHGKVTTVEDNETVPFINLILEGTRTGTLTDASGRYQMSDLPDGSHVLIVKGMGFEAARKVFEIENGQNLEINIEVEYRGIDLQEIVVTSSPVSRGFRYQPDNSYVGEELQKRSEISFGEMLDGEPGIAMRSMGPTPSRPVIRGLDGDRILILQNGERMGDISETSAGHAISLDPLSASRVEVVRGPASLLYGSSAIGGVINLMTSDIPDQWDPGASGVVSVQGASMNNMGAGFGRYTWGNENWAASGRFGYRKAGDVRSPAGIIPSTYMDNYDGSVGLGFNKDNTSGGFNFSAGMQSYGIPEELDEPDEKAEVRIQQQMMQGRLNFGLNGFFDKGQVRIHASKFIQQEMAIELHEGITREDLEIEFDKFNISSTMTLQHKPVGILDRGALGLNIYSRLMNIAGDDAFTPDENRYNIGLFTFQEIPVTTRLRLQFGVRLDFLRATALPNDFSQMNQSRDALVYSGSAGINYRPFEYLEVGGQIARSHRYPMLEELFAHGPHLCAGLYEVGSIELDDEIGYGSDLFARWTNGVLKSELALFYNFFSNYIIMQPTGEDDPDSGLPVVSYQGDRAKLYGGEASMGWQILKGLTANLGVDYVYGRRISNGSEYLPFIPPLRVSGKIEYDYGSGWVGSDIRAVSAQNNVAPGEYSTEGYALIAVNAGYRLNGSGQHVIILRVENLLDVQYRDHLTRIEERNYPMPGRNINLAYRWFF